ncbi:GNAT family protein [Bacillus sp. FJAT-47783]|uniref:GNAT family N-acetyltransferase n=1 Tax=Bacillus sp. FJAT-47783 TaxID=2922712 RepID=UPI001FADA364|nr:GNAT family protein [Bacillus sp. FJAT-47783]
MDKNVLIRRIKTSDYPILWQYIYGEKDPEWKKWDAPYFPLEEITYEEFCEDMDEIVNDKIPRRKVIEVNGEVIGAVSYYWEHRPSNWLEAGIVIYHPDYWSGGYGTEALRLWVDELFHTLPLVRVGITTWSGNKRMIRCAEKLGMKLEGRLRKCRLYKGKYYDSIRMGILREEWENIRNS